MIRSDCLNTICYMIGSDCLNTICQMTGSDWIPFVIWSDLTDWIPFARWSDPTIWIPFASWSDLTVWIPFVRWLDLTNTICQMIGSGPELPVLVSVSHHPRCHFCSLLWEGSTFAEWVTGKFCSRLLKRTIAACVIMNLCQMNYLKPPALEVIYTKRQSQGHPTSCASYDEHHKAGSM